MLPSHGYVVIGLSNVDPDTAIPVALTLDGMTARQVSGRVLTGAAIGAVAGALLPVISWPLGLAAGIGFALYQRIKK